MKKKMWSEETLLKLVPYVEATLKSRGRKSASRILTGVQTIDTDTPIEVWRTYTMGERAYYVLFYLFICRNNEFVLRHICPMDKYYNFILSVRREKKRRYYDVTRMSDRVEELFRKDAKRRQEKAQTKAPRHVGWTREDVTSEFYDETGEPRLGPPKRKLEPNLPVYESAHSSPVRHVPVEEYLATRSTKYGGVKPQFEKESEHFAKEIPRDADKNLEGYDGYPVDQFIGFATNED